MFPLYCKRQIQLVDDCKKFKFVVLKLFQQPVWYNILADHPYSNVMGFVWFQFDSSL